MRFSILLFGLTTFLFLNGCSTFQSQTRAPSSTEYVDPQYQEFFSLMNEALSFRAEAITFLKSKKMISDDPSKDLGDVEVVLSRQESEYVRSVGAKYLALRQRLLDMARGAGVTFEGQNQVFLTPGKGTRIEIAHPAQNDGPGAVLEVRTTYVDPSDAKGQELIFRMQMGLAASLILMDNYMVAIEAFNNNSSLRYVLNYDIKEKRKALQDIADSYSSIVYRQQISRAIGFVEKLMEWRRQKGVPTGAEESKLYGLSQSSIWYLAVINGRTGSGLGDAFSNLLDRLSLRGKRGLRAASFGLSMGFGNLVGLVEERKGYLYNMAASEKADLIANMKPLDILLEKTPFRLTDKMIPGHYGHVAIWLGTEQQLKDLKVWDSLDASIQAKIRSGHRIVEALRPGVEINTLDHFLNIDDFLVLRDVRPGITDEYRRAAIHQAVAQIGLPYDFNFDVHSHARIVCSEIAYVVFSDIQWPTEEVVRRYTISPDNVAQLAYGPNKKFEPVILYYNGKRYFKDLDRSLQLLLKADDASYAEFERFQNQ
ncbi:MAG: YiiX/YebB-like N1pC/P60 family cysteine hydrolase [Bdellovibrio sp.]